LHELARLAELVGVQLAVGVGVELTKCFLLSFVCRRSAVWRAGVGSRSRFLSRRGD
jgi:hypothetical protein